VNGGPARFTATSGPGKISLMQEFHWLFPICRNARRDMECSGAGPSSRGCRRRHPAMLLIS